MPKFLTTDEVAKQLNISSRTVRNLCNEGKIIFHFIGSQIRISEEDLKKYLNDTRKEVKNNDEQ